jgi:hypothetical protein
VQDAAGLFGAFCGVLGEVAGDLAANLGVVKRADVELVAPADAAVAEFVGQRRRHGVDGLADRVLEQLAREPAVRRADLVGAVLGHRAVEPDDGV